MSTTKTVAALDDVTFIRHEVYLSMRWFRIHWGIPPDAHYVVLERLMYLFDALLARAVTSEQELPVWEKVLTELKKIRAEVGQPMKDTTATLETEKNQV